MFFEKALEIKRKTNGECFLHYQKLVRKKFPE